MLPDYCIPTQKWMQELEDQGYRVIDVPTPINQDKMYQGHLDNWGLMIFWFVVKTMLELLKL